MSSGRMDVLKSMLQQDARNSFARYGLAMELVKAGELAQAVQEFSALLASDPDYVAAYFHGGQSLEKLGRLDDARELYERGLQASRKIGDSHSAAEIQAALDLL